MHIFIDLYESNHKPIYYLTLTWKIPASTWSNVLIDNDSRQTRRRQRQTLSPYFCFYSSIFDFSDTRFASISAPTMFLFQLYSPKRVFFSASQISIILRTEGLCCQTDDGASQKLYLSQVNRCRIYPLSWKHKTSLSLCKQVACRSNPSGPDFVTLWSKLNRRRRKKSIYSFVHTQVQSDGIEC